MMVEYKVWRWCGQHADWWRNNRFFFPVASVKVCCCYLKLSIHKTSSLHCKCLSHSHISGIRHTTPYAFIYYSNSFIIYYTCRSIAETFLLFNIQFSLINCVMHFLFLTTCYDFASGLMCHSCTCTEYHWDVTAHLVCSERWEFLTLGCFNKRGEDGCKHIL